MSPLCLLTTYVHILYYKKSAYKNYDDDDAMMMVGNDYICTYCILGYWPYPFLHKFIFLYVHTGYSQVK